MFVASLYQKKWLLIHLPIAAAALSVAVFAWKVFFPMPPTQLSITTAGAPGSYHSMGLRYAERFATYGVTLDVKTSDGSQQNMQRFAPTRIRRIWPSYMVDLATSERQQSDAKEAGSKRWPTSKLKAPGCLRETALSRHFLN